MRPDEFIVPAPKRRLRKSSRDALAQAGGPVAGGVIVIDVSMIVLDDPRIAGRNPCGKRNGGGHQKLLWANEANPYITEAFAASANASRTIYILTLSHSRECPSERGETESVTLSGHSFRVAASRSPPPPTWIGPSPAFDRLQFSKEFL